MVNAKTAVVIACGIVCAALWAVDGATQPPAAPAAAQSSSEAPAGNVERGKMLYRKTGCYQCHSDEGQGGTQGPRVGPNPVPYRTYVSYMRRPTGEMPPYSEKVMSDQDLADVYAFMRALPNPPPLSSIPLLQQ